MCKFSYQIIECIIFPPMISFNELYNCYLLCVHKQICRKRFFICRPELVTENVSHESNVRVTCIIVSLSVSDQCRAIVSDAVGDA